MQNSGRRRNFKKINSKKKRWHSNTVAYLMVKFQLYLRKLIIQALSALAGLNGKQVSKLPFN